MPVGNGPGIFQPPAPGQDALIAGIERASITAVTGTDPEDEVEDNLGPKMLRFVKEFERSAETYATFTRRTWDRTYRAFRNQHFEGSKYTSKEFNARSKLFRPKTRSGVRKMMASTVSSLFSTVDAIAIQAGNEADQKSRAAAALMQEVVNYRLDRTSGRNAIPWFKTATGAVQDATLTGIVVSKQDWKLQVKEVKQVGLQADPMMAPPPQYKTIFDRPSIVCVAPENVLIDAGADWTDPAQSAACLILKWPMYVDQIRQNEKDPRDPWMHLEDSVLKSARDDRTTGQPMSIRTNREGGTDRFSSYNQADEFCTVWVYECFIRHEGEDYTFFSLRDQHLLTDPRPVDEVYPWNDGERPVVIGYGSLESHKIFPMAPAESWQPLQAEINDLANLTLDTVKMNIAPLAKVIRGRQVDLDKLRARAPGTNILMQGPDDVTFEKPPGVDAGAWAQMERLNADFDTLAGQFDAGSVQTNRQMNETVGGMRLINGAANALQEFDQRVFFETWAEPSLGQMVKLCQFYEHDETVLGLCGERAQLWEKHGVNEITNELIEAQITTRIDIGIGAGDPQQRMVKFQSAAAIMGPILASHPKVQSGEVEIDLEAVGQEVFGAAGYRDGGKRFFKINPPPQGPNPIQEAELADKQASAAQKRSAANLNDAKAMSTAQEARLHAMELVADLMGQSAERHERAITRDDEERNRQEDRHDTHRQRQEDRQDTHQARQEEHKLKRDVAGAKSKSNGKAKPKESDDAGDQLRGMLSEPREQEVSFIRGPDGKIAGARMGDRTIEFKRDHNGRIAGAKTIDGGNRAAPPTPPSDLQAMISRGMGR